MVEIVRLNKKSIDELAEIEFESEHEVEKARGITVKECKAELIERFAHGYEMFFGYKEDGVLKGYVTLIPFFRGTNIAKFIGFQCVKHFRARE